jgi:hypothetical protein
MEVLVVVLVIVALIGLSRLWVSRSNKPSDDDIDSPSGSSSSVFFNSTNPWVIDQTIQSIDTPETSSTFEDSQPSQSASPQDCSRDFSNDNSGSDCPCPADSTSYDAGGCPVDSGSFDAGSSN